MDSPIRTPVLILGGRRIIDEETIMCLLSDADPVLTLTLERYVACWVWEKVVPVEGGDDEGADDPGEPSEPGDREGWNPDTLQWENGGCKMCGSHGMCYC